MKKNTTPTPKATPTEEQFWGLVEGLNPKSRSEDLKSRLLKLAPQDLVEFDSLFSTAVDSLNSWNLWAAMHLIHDHRCSDDLFEYSQYGLVARGKAVFEATRENPDSIATWLKPGEWVADEAVAYAARYAYEEITGNEEMPYGESRHEGGWAGDESLMKTDRGWKKAFPKLHAMFRGPRPAAKAPKTKVKVLEAKSAGVKTLSKANAPKTR